MTTTSTETRYRGCIIGGHWHGQPIPEGFHHGRIEAPQGAYVHRRLAKHLDNGNLESVEFLVLESLSDEEARRLVDQERAARGGWGEPIVTLPTAGFRFEVEGNIADWTADAPGALTGFGLVKRYSPQGVAIARDLTDTSRPLARDEADQARCEWCAHGVGHTIALHRDRLEADAAERRHAAVNAQRQAPERTELSMGLDEILEVEASGEPYSAFIVARELERVAMRQAEEEFRRRRQAELEPEPPALILPSGFSR